jgi:hypothetical protein
LTSARSSNDNPLAILDEETATLVEGLRTDSLASLSYDSTEFMMIFHIFGFGFETIKSIRILLSVSRFKECFALFRTVLETYMQLLLATRGTKYRESMTYRVKPDSGHAAVQARDRTLENWRKEWKSGNPNYRSVADMQKGREEDEIVIVHEWEGLYSTEDTEKKGRPISRFIFALEEYSPDDRFLTSLRTISEGDPFLEISKREQEEQKKLYHYYIYVESLIKNLRLNNIISAEQEDRVVVHYNYLSSFTHPSKRSLDFSEEMRTTGALPEDVEQLLLLYICKFDELFLSAVTEFFSKVNEKAQLSAYEAQIKQLHIATREFWFLFEDPLASDFYYSDMAKEMVKMMKNKLPDPKVVLYYKNPLERLVKMKGFERAFPGLNAGK